RIRHQRAPQPEALQRRRNAKPQDPETGGTASRLYSPGRSRAFRRRAAANFGDQRAVALRRDGQEKEVRQRMLDAVADMAHALLRAAPRLPWKAWWGGPPGPRRPPWPGPRIPRSSPKAGQGPARALWGPPHQASHAPLCAPCAWLLVSAHGGALERAPRHQPRGLCHRVSRALLVFLTFICAYPQQQRDFLSEAEGDQIRDAQEPNERLALYLKFARLRLELVKQAMAVEKPGRSKLIHNNLEDYSRIIEALDAVIDDAVARKLDVAKGVGQVAEREKEFLAMLQEFSAKPVKDR